MLLLVIVLLLVFFASHRNPTSFLFRFENVANPLDASSAELAGGRAGPALVFGNVHVPSPLFAIFPGLAGFYRSAPFVLCLVLSLLQAQWTYTGYDASAHLSEETEGAANQAARGIWQSIFYSAIGGWILLLSFVFAATIFGLASCVHGPTQAALVADLAPARLRGRYMALSSMSWEIGFVIGPGIGGCS